jgi:hypothetical protein
MRKAAPMPAPSPTIFRYILGSLPANLREAIKDEPHFTCLSRELQELDMAIAAVDQIEQAAGNPSSVTPLIRSQAARREERAFLRSGIVAQAVVDNAVSPAQLALALLAILAAGQAMPDSTESFPWPQLRQLLEATAEI